MVHRGTLVAMLALLLVGCGTSAPPDEDSNTGAGSPTELSTVPPTGEVTGLPAPEGSGPEKPQQGGGGGLALPVPSLPVGGAVQPPDREPFCAPVGLIANLPAAVSISVKSKSIHVGPAFTLLDSGGGCGRLCRDGFTFTSEQTTCFVPVKATGSSGETASLVLDGEVRCPAGQDEACRRFVDADQHGAVELTVPSLDEPEPPDTASTGPTGWYGG
jgi:hypothetical protein